jgi:hypothetical protein
LQFQAMFNFTASCVAIKWYGRQSCLIRFLGGEHWLLSSLEVDEN